MSVIVCQIDDYLFDRICDLFESTIRFARDGRKRVQTERFSGMCQKKLPLLEQAKGV